MPGATAQGCFEVVIVEKTHLLPCHLMEVDIMALLAMSPSCLQEVASQQLAAVEGNAAQQNAPEAWQDPVQAHAAVAAAAGSQVRPSKHCYMLVCAPINCRGHPSHRSSKRVLQLQRWWVPGNTCSGIPAQLGSVMHGAVMVGASNTSVALVHL